MPVVQELLTKWGIKADTVALAKMNKGIRSVAMGAGILAGYATLIVTAITKITKHAINTADELDKTSQAIGVNVESLQKLRYAGKISGLEMEGMNTAISRFSRAMNDAQYGTKKTIKSFQEAGLSLSDINNKLLKTEDAIAKIADRFKTMPDGPKKTALAMEIFGRSGARLIPLLNQGSAGINKLTQEAELYGLVMNKDMIKSAVEAKDNFTRLGYIIEQIKLKIGIGLVPEVNKLVLQLLAWYKENKQIIDQKIKDFVTEMIKAFKSAIKILSTFLKVVSFIAKVLGGYDKLFKVVIAGIMAFAAFKIIYGITMLSLAFKALGISIAAVGNASLIAWTKALWPIAAFLVFALALEDVIRMLLGHKSVIGELLGISKDDIKLFQEWIDSWLHPAIQFILDFPEKLFGKVKWFFDKIQRIDDFILGKNQPTKTVNNVSRSAANLTYSPTITVNAPSGDGKDISKQVDIAIKKDWNTRLNDLDEMYVGASGGSR